MSQVNVLVRRRMGRGGEVDDVVEGDVQQGAIEMRVVDGPVFVDEDGDEGGTEEDGVEEAVVVGRFDGLSLQDYEDFMSRCDARMARANLLSGRNILLLSNAEARGRRLERGGLSLNEMLQMREDMDEADLEMRRIDEEIVAIGVEQRRDSVNLWKRHRGVKESLFGSNESGMDRMDRDHVGSSDGEDGNGEGRDLAPGSG